jgi:predicted nuclease of predicted toxin-antitoxin system
LKILLDENLSPRLVWRISEVGIVALHIGHLGRSGMSDPALWRFAFDNDAAVATINARDFLVLASAVDLHPGLIVLRRSGLSPAGQWRLLEPAIRFGLAEEAAGRSLVNRVVEVVAVGALNVFDLPAEGR